jgi:molybdopterin-guanine dinucleotide biosynthesis protein A
MRSAVILAGGFSRRLGQEKSLLEFEGKPLVCWTLGKLSSVVDEVLVVARDEAHAMQLIDAVDAIMPGVAVFAWDELKDYGPVAGLCAGMKKAKGEMCFASACDLPFLNPRVVDRLFQIALKDEEDGLGFDGAVPVHSNGMVEPLHCVYKREKMQKACERAMNVGEKKVHAPLRELAVRSVSVDLLRPLDEELLTFFNLNTREDLEKARVIWPKYRSGLGWQKL